MACTCGFCGASIDSIVDEMTGPISCTGCRTSYHLDCYQENEEACGMFGCVYTMHRRSMFEEPELYIGEDTPTPVLHPPRQTIYIGEVHKKRIPESSGAAAVVAAALAVVGLLAVTYTSLPEPPRPARIHYRR